MNKYKVKKNCLLLMNKYKMLNTVKDKYSNRKGTQITLHLSRAWIDLATYGLREKRLDLLPREVHCFS